MLSNAPSHPVLGKKKREVGEGEEGKLMYLAIEGGGDGRRGEIQGGGGRSE